MRAGYYFCSLCNDVVHQAFTERYEYCSRCGNRSAVWTVAAPKKRAVSPAEGKELFEQVRRAVKEV